MNDDTLHRIKISVQIDVMLELIEESDGQGMVWCEGPYDVTIPLALPVTTPLPVTDLDDDDRAWILQAALISVGVGLLASVVILLILAWSIYAAMGVILWFIVSSVT